MFANFSMAGIFSATSRKHFILLFVMTSFTFFCPQPPFPISLWKRYELLTTVVTLKLSWAVLVKPDLLAYKVSGIYKKLWQRRPDNWSLDLYVLTIIILFMFPQGNNSFFPYCIRIPRATEEKTCPYTFLCVDVIKCSCRRSCGRSAYGNSFLDKQRARAGQASRFAHGNWGLHLWNAYFHKAVQKFALYLEPTC